MIKENWLGTWILRDGRKVPITSNPKDTILNIGSVHISIFEELWDVETGMSKFGREWDLMERERDAKLSGE